MKLNFGLLGIALAQSGDYVDDSSDERHDYSYDYNLGNHHHHHNHHNDFGHHHHMSFNHFGGKGDDNTKRVLAQRLSCWNSNSLRDMNHDQKFFDHTSDMYHHYNHQYGFENAYYHEGVHGTHELQDYGDVVDQDHLIDVNDNEHNVMAIDPNKWGYQSDNRDAKYHYGHHLHDEDRSSNPNRPHHYQISDNEDSFDGVIDDWRYSLRHAGCLYEAPDYFYGADTFNTLRFLTYSMDYHDYPNADHSEDHIGRLTNVHWVHVFNAHIHIDSGVYCLGEGSSNNHGITENDCINTDPIHQFAVVMANPTYEGLGFLNFVATYHDPHDPSNPVEEAGHRFRSNYEFSALYENSGFWHLSSTGHAMTTSPTWHLQCDENGCENLDWHDGTNHKGLAISSFPHNQLGKDFRFNIRTLHTMGDGWYRAFKRTATDSNTAYSYFFYGISSIQVKFPEYVGHVNDCWRFRNVGNCESHMVHQVIVDQSSVQVTSQSPQNHHGDIAYGNHQFVATLSHSDMRCMDSNMGIGHGAHQSNACASWCANHGQTINGHNVNTQSTITTQTVGTNTFCGDTLTISGIHRTYDELHLRQFGTIQEIWVQLMYAYSHATTYDASNSNAAVEGFESPFPNVFFSAPQVLAVTGACVDADYGKCDGYTRVQNVPYAGSDTDASRWADDVDGLGSQRGDAFWPDDHDTDGR